MDHSVVVGPSTSTGPDRFGAVSRQARRGYGASEATNRALDLRLALASLVDCVAALSAQAPVPACACRSLRLSGCEPTRCYWHPACCGSQLEAHSSPRQRGPLQRHPACPAR